MHYANPCMQNTKDTIAKYAVDANLFQLGSTGPKKNIKSLEAFWWGAKPSSKNNYIFFSKMFQYLNKK